MAAKQTLTPPRRNWLARAWRNWVLVPAGYGRPIPAEAADREFREGHWDHFGDETELPRYRRIAELIARRGTPVSVLDLGCGDGRLAHLLPPGSCRRYLGVDFSAEGIRRARSRPPPAAEYVVADFHTWRSDERFDIIVYGESLGYADDPAAVVRRHLPSLATGGEIIVSQYRHGTRPSLWRRIEHGLRTLHSDTVGNGRGQAWDIKVLQPPAS